MTVSKETNEPVLGLRTKLVDAVLSFPWTGVQVSASPPKFCGYKLECLPHGGIFGTSQPRLNCA